MSTTILDEMVVLLGLDASKYTEGQKQAQKAMDDTQATVMRSAEAMGSSIMGVAGKLTAMFLGFKGLEGVVSLVKNTALEMKQLGIMAEIAGASVRDMRTMQEYSELAGAGPNATSDFGFGIQRQLFGMTLGQIPMPWLMNAVLPGFDVTRWAWNPNQKEKWTQLQQALTAPGVGERLSAQIPGNPSPRQAEMAAAMGMGMPQQLAENLTNLQEFNKAMQPATKTNKDMNEQVAKNARAAADAMIDLKYATENQATRGFPLLTTATHFATDMVNLFGKSLDEVTKLLDSLMKSPVVKWLEGEGGGLIAGETGKGGSGLMHWLGNADRTQRQFDWDVLKATESEISKAFDWLTTSTGEQSLRLNYAGRGTGYAPALAPIAMPSLPIVSLPGSLIGPGGKGGNNSTVSIGNMQINTAATDAQGLAADMRSAMQRKFNVTQADGGVVV